jgi:hypothetical protein
LLLEDLRRFASFKQEVAVGDLRERPVQLELRRRDRGTPATKNDQMDCRRQEA